MGRRSRDGSVRQVVAFVGLNWRLDGVSLAVEMRKPFDALVEGLLSNKSRGERI